MTTPARIELSYTVRVPEDGWVCPEGPVPESIPHSRASRHLVSVISFWAARSPTPRFVAQNLAIRWQEERPQVGIDPDVCLLEPPPPDVNSLRSLCLWKEGHVAPSICFEIVSASHPYKDYVAIHERYAQFAPRELVVFDPQLLGPRSLGGPVILQIWRHDGVVLERQYAGPGPVFSEILGAWLFADHGLLELSKDRDGQERWPTEQAYERAEKERERAEKERERAEKERERAEKERERAARLEVERRLAEIEARLDVKARTER